MRKFVPYYEHIASRRFRVQRKIAYLLAFGRCSVCFQKHGLQAHHLGYSLVGSWFEFLSLRIVCDTCHKNVQTILGRMTNNTLALILNYYIYRMWGILLYIVRSYWIPRR